jgi:hypothetical protein
MSESASEAMSQRLRPVTITDGPTERGGAS